jgi:molybdopterin converting factor small subunit
MSIKVHIPWYLQELTDGVKVIEVKGNTVGECFKHLVKKFPNIKEALFDKNGNLVDYADIYINEESSYPEELAKPVNNGDELSIVFIVSGG